MELQHLAFSFSIHIKSWKTNQVRSLAVREGKIFLDNKIVSQIDIWYGFRGRKFFGLIEQLQHKFPDFFEIPTLTDVRITLDPDSYEPDLVHLLQFQPQKDDLRLYEEYDQIRSGLFFDVAPVSLNINGYDWIVTQDLEEVFLHPREWSHNLYVIAGAAEEERFIFGKVRQGRTAFLHFNERHGLSYEVAGYKIKTFAATFSLFKAFVAKQVPVFQPIAGYLDLLDVAVAEAARTEERNLDSPLNKLFKLDPDADSDAVRVPVGEILKAKRKLNGSKIKVQLDEAFGEDFVGSHQSVFLASWAHQLAPASLSRMVVKAIRAVTPSEVPCLLDTSYAAARYDVTDYKLLTEAALKGEIDAKIQVVEGKLAEYRSRLKQLQAEFGGDIYTFNHACNYIERYEFVHSPEYTNQLWLAAYEIRNNPAAKIDELEQSLAEFRKKALATAEIRAELQWPDEWPPLLAPIWQEYGAEPEAAARWFKRGWNAADVLVRERIPGCGGLLLIERLNHPHPPAKAGA